MGNRYFDRFGWPLGPYAKTSFWTKTQKRFNIVQTSSLSLPKCQPIENWTGPRLQGVSAEACNGGLLWQWQVALQRVSNSWSRKSQVGISEFQFPFSNSQTVSWFGEFKVAIGILTAWVCAMLAVVLWNKDHSHEHPPFIQEYFYFSRWKRNWRTVYTSHSFTCAVITDESESLLAVCVIGVLTSLTDCISCWTTVVVDSLFVKEVISKRSQRSSLPNTGKIAVYGTCFFREFPLFKKYKDCQYQT